MGGKKKKKWDFKNEGKRRGARHQLVFFLFFSKRRGQTWERILHGFVEYKDREIDRELERREKRWSSWAVALIKLITIICRGAKSSSAARHR